MVFEFIPTQDLTGKTVVVTGGSSGVGKVSCTTFARLNAHVIIAGRNRDKTQGVIDDIIKTTGNPKVEFLQLQLDDLASVKAAAQALLDRGSDFKIDILMNNAGIASIPGLTKDGYEIQFGTNHLGPFLFTELLLPLVKRTDHARIVFLSSRAASNGSKFDWTKAKEPFEGYTKMKPYCDSKLANAVYAAKLAQMLKEAGITTYSLHPGVVATDIWRAVPWPLNTIAKLFMLTEEQGAMTQLFCALEPRLASESGLYYDDCKAVHVNDLVRDQEYMDELYTKTRELLVDYL
ncbi:hypothetical protein HDU91_005344 [Kappamyces sp. JEL0680]|nr:hypothetical protein HDU91_005344 [Kappamyces sp. JEL0680]